MKKVCRRYLAVLASLLSNFHQIYAFTPNIENRRMVFHTANHTESMSILLKERFLCVTSSPKKYGTCPFMKGLMGNDEVKKPDEVKRSDEEKAMKVSSNSWIMLLVLLMVYISNQWSRNVLPYVVNFGIPFSESAARNYVNVELGFDEVSYGVLASYGFTLLFSISSLAAGRTVDTMSKKSTTVASCLIWSIATLLQGFTFNLPQVLALRVLQGVSQAFATPAAYAMIAQCFPVNFRATSNAIYSSGIYLGGALASLTVFLDANIGWRNCFILVGGIGIGCASVSQLVLHESYSYSISSKSLSEPIRDKEKPLSTLKNALYLIATSKKALLVYLASAARFMSGFSIAIWLAPFFRAEFPDRIYEFALVNAAAVAVGGVLSALAGGYLSDKLSVFDCRYRAWVPMIGSLLAVPCWIGTINSGNFNISMVCLFLKYAVAECWFGPTVAILQGSLPVQVQGTAQGIFSVMTAVGNIAPLLIGAAAVNYSLKDVLLYSVSAMYAVSAFIFYVLSANMSECEDSSKKHS